MYYNVTLDQTRDHINTIGKQKNINRTSQQEKSDQKLGATLIFKWRPKANVTKFDWSV